MFSKKQGRRGGGGSGGGEGRRWGAWFQGALQAFGLLVLLQYVASRLFKWPPGQEQQRQAQREGGSGDAAGGAGRPAAGQVPQQLDGGSSGAALQRALQALASWEQQEQQLQRELRALPSGWALGKAGSQARERRAEVQRELEALRTLRCALLAHLQEQGLLQRP
jgi:hypothetical protein